MKYQITVEFEASNLLDERESSVLVAAVLAQIEDPCGVDILQDKRARYSTTITKAQLENGFFTTTFTPEASVDEAVVS